MPGGFLPRCWTDGRQVLKVWDDRLPASLAVLGDLDLPVVVPEAATVIAGYRVAMFPFVRGRRATGTDAPALARAMRLMHDHQLVDLPRLPIEESWCVETRRGLLDHPWISDRRPEVEAQLDRLEGATERARATPRPDVICHTDLGGHNALVDDDTGAVVAILDWDYARLAPREHDLWAALEKPDPCAYLDAYGRDVDLDCAHLEYALLARALRDATARVATERDRDGIDPWGFDRWRRLDSNLELLRPRP
jgi:Ser/Thr protein kinase RdoA (MazF antagonist)